jgi:hypothetical protein
MAIILDKKSLWFPLVSGIKLTTMPTHLGRKTEEHMLAISPSPERVSMAI